MNGWMRGFFDELVKVSEATPGEIKAVLREARKDDTPPLTAKEIRSLRGSGGPVSRDYLASMAIGGVAAPLLAIAGKGVSRALHNRAVTKALRGVHSPAKRKDLIREMQTGSLVGRLRPDLPSGARPLLTPADIVSESAKGILGGSLVQMMRDRYSGSAKSER